MGLVEAIWLWHLGGPGRGGLDSNSFFIFVLVWIEISLNTGFDLTMLPLSGPKVCGGGWLLRPISVLSLDQQYFNKS